MWSRGKGLDAIIKHLAHYRGQLTVLMRQAGLKVHGVYMDRQKKNGQLMEFLHNPEKQSNIQSE